MDYASLKLLHQVTALLSITGFVVRGVAALMQARWVRGRSARTLPHVVDTLLLASALGLLWELRLNPLEVPWLLVKIVGLLLYIVLGTLALRPGMPRPLVALWLVLALLCFAQIAAMAIGKSVLGLAAGWG